MSHGLNLILIIFVLSISGVSGTRSVIQQSNNVRNHQLTYLLLLSAGFHGTECISSGINHVGCWFSSVLTNAVVIFRFSVLGCGELEALI
jgi:hypothetical protein